MDTVIELCKSGKGQTVMGSLSADLILPVDSIELHFPSPKAAVDTLQEADAAWKGYKEECLRKLEAGERLTINAPLEEQDFSVLVRGQGQDEAVGKMRSLFIAERLLKITRNHRPITDDWEL